MNHNDRPPDDIPDCSTLARTIEAGLDLCAETRVLATPREIAGDAGILERVSFLEQTERAISELVGSLSNNLTSIRSQIVSLRQTAPVNKLPVEILQRIFFMGYVDVELPLWRDVHVRTICSVCRLWRAIATSQSELWTIVSLDSAQPYVRLCVERAGTQQFDITHGINMQRSDTSPRPWVLHGVCPFNRWKSLSVAFGEESASWKVFKKVAPHLSHLRKLTVETYWCLPNQLHQKEELLRISKLFPNLVSLYILWLPKASFNSALSFSLLDLRIDMELSEMNLATIFRECSSLRRLWISTVSPEISDDGSDWNSTGIGEIHSVQLSAPTTLESIVLAEDVDTGGLRCIVQRLEAPNLKELGVLMDAEINLGGTDWSESIANLVSLGRVLNSNGLTHSGFPSSFIASRIY
jgi:hypothetical protein